MKRTPEERFWAKVRKSDKLSGCWDWIAGKSHDGYGMFWTGVRKEYAHRWAYKQLVGGIPESLCCDHLCRNRGCVNPDHLEFVDIRENILRGESSSAAYAKRIECSRGHTLPTGQDRSCLVCRAERTKNWRMRHSERYRMSQQIWRQENKAYMREWHQQRREERNARARERYRARRGL